YRFYKCALSRQLGIAGKRIDCVESAARLLEILAAQDVVERILESLCAHYFFYAESALCLLSRVRLRACPLFCGEVPRWYEEPLLCSLIAEGDEYQIASRHVYAGQIHEIVLLAELCVYPDRIVLPLSEKDYYAVARLLHQLLSA